MTQHEKLEKLLSKYFAELQNHSILKKYWEKTSLVLKGSFSRNFADEYTDLDFVIFTDKTTYKEICSNYFNLGLTPRKNGVFLPLGDWDGHYNLDTFNNFENNLKNDISLLWEFSNAKILHDCEEKIKNAVFAFTDLFHKKINSTIRKQYLNIQLQLDWMRQPLRRADKQAALIYGANFWIECCRLLYLIENKPYPCDKWIFYYLNTLSYFEEFKNTILQYGNTFNSVYSLKKGTELTEYEMYSKGIIITEKLQQILHNRFKNAKWIDEWYLFA